jgi:hypothetical protein
MCSLQVNGSSVYKSAANGCSVLLPTTTNNSNNHSTYHTAFLLTSQPHTKTTQLVYHRLNHHLHIQTPSLSTQTQQPRQSKPKFPNPLHISPPANPLTQPHQPLQPSPSPAMCFSITIKYTCEHYEYDGVRRCYAARKALVDCDEVEAQDEDAGFQCQSCEPRDWQGRLWC